jgi:hypothetical protein
MLAASLIIAAPLLVGGAKLLAMFTDLSQPHLGCPVIPARLLAFFLALLMYAAQVEWQGIAREIVIVKSSLNSVCDDAICIKRRHKTQSAAAGRSPYLLEIRKGSIDTTDNLDMTKQFLMPLEGKHMAICRRNIDIHTDKSPSQTMDPRVYGMQIFHPPGSNLTSKGA